VEVQRDPSTTKRLREAVDRAWLTSLAAVVKEGTVVICLLSIGCRDRH
jgi:hypothetical protein